MKIGLLQCLSVFDDYYILHKVNIIVDKKK